jgi:hypothetical protein
MNTKSQAVLNSAIFLPLSEKSRIQFAPPLIQKNAAVEKIKTQFATSLSLPDSKFFKGKLSTTLEGASYGAIISCLHEGLKTSAPSLLPLKLGVAAVGVGAIVYILYRSQSYYRWPHNDGDRTSTKFAGRTAGGLIGAAMGRYWWGGPGSLIGGALGANAGELAVDGIYWIANRLNY